MILTQAAIDKALTLLPSGNILRIAVKGGGCAGYQYELGFTDQQLDTDTVQNYGDLTVIMDERSSEMLEQITLDYVDALNGSGFKFINPNATNTCGCGNSFGCP